jgi:hypothetical protein
MQLAQRHEGFSTVWQILPDAHRFADADNRQPLPVM